MKSTNYSISKTPTTQETISPALMKPKNLELQVNFKNRLIDKGSNRISKIEYIIYSSKVNLCLIIYWFISDADLGIERDIFLYRSYLALKKYGIVRDEIKAGSPDLLLPLKTLAAYLSAGEGSKKVSTILLGCIWDMIGRWIRF